VPVCIVIERASFARSFHFRIVLEWAMLHITSTNWKKVFFFIWTGQAFSLVGSQIIHFSIAWWLTETTGSAAILVTVPLFAMIPQVLMGPFIGALVDRWDRRRVMIVADTMVALCTLWLAVMFFTGWIEIWHLFVTAFLRGIGGSFHWPAMQASTSLMVPKEQLSRVAGMNQTLQGVLNIGAPPLGALLVGLMPMWGIMAIDVVTAGIAIVPLLFVAILRPAVAPQAVGAGGMASAVLRDVRAGLRYVLGWPGMVAILFLATFINFLLTPASVLLPLLVTRHFNGGPWHLGALESAWGVGVIAGGLLLSTWGGFKRKVVTSMMGIALLGITSLMIGLAPASLFLMAVAGQALSGIMNPLINGPLMALIQERIAPEMQGRVFTLVGSAAGAMAPLGMIAAAPVADRFGVQAWFIIGGIYCLLAGTAAFFIPAIMNIERGSNAAAAPAAEIVSAD
jgi:MFS transporter, DHA3 family, macrolide efflux protein